MRICVVHGQGHKGVTYTMTHEIIRNLPVKPEDIKEFFLPQDGPSFCVGCNTCFLKGEEHCPEAHKVQPIMQAMEWADVIVLDSPNYVLEMSGSMKNLLDHFGYRWVTHRPSGTMFHKVGITVCSSAGAPCTHTVKSMEKQLKWMCVPKVYRFPFICNALGIHDLKPKKREEMEKKARKIAKKVKKYITHPRASFRSKFFFGMFRKMEMSPDAAWNPTDQNWWIQNGWTKDIRPWKALQRKKDNNEKN